MYFSKHNEKTVYINHYSGLLEVEGGGISVEKTPRRGRHREKTGGTNMTP